MRTLVLLAFGLFAGALGSQLVSGCGCPDQVLLEPGAYVPSDAKTAESDYTLTLSADRGSVTETYTRGGAAYTVVYSATPQER